MQIFTYDFQCDFFCVDNIAHDCLQYITAVGSLVLNSSVAYNTRMRRREWIHPDRYSLGDSCAAHQMNTPSFYHTLHGWCIDSQSRICLHYVASTISSTL